MFQKRKLSSQNPKANVLLDTDAPIYALVMGTETRFIKRQGTKLYFSVDPDDIGKLLLGIIEEELGQPFASRKGTSCRESPR